MDAPKIQISQLLSEITKGAVAHPPKKKDRSCKAFFGFTTSVFCFKLIVVNKKTQKQEQHIEILEKSQQLKFRMPTEIRISKHNALYQASIQLEELDYTKLYRAYSGIRKSQIEPRVLFKVLVCAYMKGVYSSRKIEELCRENLVFRWLLEDQKTPDHCTIARFRGNRNLQEAFEDLFFQYVKKLENKGYDIDNIKQSLFRRACLSYLLFGNLGVYGERFCASGGI